MQQQRGGTVRGDCDRYIPTSSYVARYMSMLNVATESVSGSLELDGPMRMQCNESSPLVPNNLDLMNVASLAS